MWVTFIILSSESGITGWRQRVGLASVVSPEHCSKSTTWSVTSVAAAAENLNVMFLLWLKLSATHILLPQQSNLNVIERKFKRQILKPDPIILVRNTTNLLLNELAHFHFNVETLLASNPLQEIHSNYHQTPPSHPALNRRQKSHGGNTRITEKKYSCSKVRER